MTRWEKIKCNFFGIHDQEVVDSVRCKMWRSNLYSTERNIPGVAKV